MVGANLQSFISSHNQPCLAILLMLQESDISGSTLLPFIRVANKFEKLGAHLEGLLLELFVCLDFDFLREADYGLKMNILGFRSLILR